MRSNDASSLLDILNSAARVKRWLESMSKTQFLNDDRTQAAVVREITVVGEAVKRLSKDFIDCHPEFPWRQITGMRNVLIHVYDKVDLDDVWRVSQSSLPQLANDIAALGVIPPKPSP